MSGPLRPKINRVGAFAAVVLVVNALVCLSSLARMGSTLGRVISARETVEAIDRVFTTHQEAEIRERNYLLSGDDHDFAKVGKAILNLGPPLNDLEARAKGDPLSETRVASLRHVFRDRNERLLDAIKMRKEDGGQGASVRHLNAARGLRTLTEVQRLIKEMQEGEDRRLVESLATARSAIGKTALTVGLASSLAMVLLFVAYYATRREIVRREQAAEETRAREEWFSATLASISDAVIATDGRGCVRLINPVAQALTGWGLAESKGKPLAEVFPLISEETRAPVDNPVSRILSEGAFVGLSNHTILVARDGTEHPVEHTGAPIRDPSGAIAGAVVCFRDVAERKRVEVELRASKESADAANRAKDQFLAVLSHELRKPLTPVLVAVTGLLTEGTAPDLLPTLEMIRRNVEMESRLIDDLLDVSRIVRGGLRLLTEMVDVHETLRQAVSMFLTETMLANLDVVLELSAPRHSALADDTRLMQVFWNLITNAAKFTPEGGRLEIRTWNEGPAEVSPGPARLVVEFRDTGIGIEPDSIARIFEPFEQGDGNFRKRFGGLGLGLAISRGIVESHGGRMTASSPGRGKGATFRIELSVATAPPARPPAPVRSGPSHQAPGLKILLVEDNADTVRYLALVLGSRGHEVATAESLAAARALLSQRRFDLMISDIELPDGTGLELMREVNGLLPGIAVSGFGSDDDLRMSESAGFSLHLTKPLDVRKLDDAITRVASRPARATAVAARPSAPR